MKQFYKTIYLCSKYELFLVKIAEHCVAKLFNYASTFSSGKLKVNMISTPFVNMSQLMFQRLDKLSSSSIALIV